MNYISLETKKRMESVGFSFADYEKFLNLGMIYSYHNDEYVIGGFCNNNFTEMDEIVSQNGEWLPDNFQLLQWLQQCGFDVSILWKHEESVFYISATHADSGIYETTSVDLAEGIGSIIYKICKKTQGKCSPEKLLRAKIQCD